jgi:hypothetical protein
MKSFVEGSSFQMTTFPSQDEKNYDLKQRGEGHVGLDVWRSKSLYYTSMSYMLAKPI